MLSSFIFLVSRFEVILVLLKTVTTVDCFKLILFLLTLCQLTTRVKLRICFLLFCFAVFSQSSNREIKLIEFSFAGLLNLSTSDAEFCTNIVTVIGSSVFLNRLVELSKYSNYSFRSICELKMSSSVSLLLWLGILLELISIGFRSISLGFRFLANLSAGHVLSDISFALKFGVSLPSQVVTALLKLGLLLYESAVLVIQVCVLLALLMVYAEIT